jgi:hypothetical protein
MTQFVRVIGLSTETGVAFGIIEGLNHPSFTTIQDANQYLKDQGYEKTGEDNEHFFSKANSLVRLHQESSGEIYIVYLRDCIHQEKNWNDLTRWLISQGYTCVNDSQNIWSR